MKFKLKFKLMKNSVITAAYLIIGDEILSGRTQDENLNFIAKGLVEIGVVLKEVRVVADVENEIIEAVNQLRKKYNYLFTSGGIGPTHDDITSAAIAKAFGDKLILHKEAEQILIHWYGEARINDAVLKMAHIPQTAKLLDNPISSAPGFIMENVIVMAGVPKIMQAMFNIAKKSLISGDKITSRDIKVSLVESEIAKELTDLQNKFDDITIGSYPFQGGTTLVFRSINLQKLDDCVNQMVNIINNKNKNSIIEIN